MRYQIKYSCVSHIGNVRAVNQDNFICGGNCLILEDEPVEFPIVGIVQKSFPIVFGIFDGMGGEECGEIASYIAAKEAQTMDFSKKTAEDCLRYCKMANEKICEYIAENKLTAMGTTVAMLLFGKKKITLCNVGDSKVYRFANEKLEQISKDHVMTTVFGRKPPLSQHLGIPSSELIIEPYISQGSYKDGDQYLICSDGLTDMLTDEEIEEILQQGHDQKVVEILRDTALQHGGKDNISIIWLQVKEKHLLRLIYKG